MSFLLSLSLYLSLSLQPFLSGFDVRDHRPVHVRLTENSKGTVLIFLSAKCPCSASHEKVLNNLYKEYSPKGFRFVGIHSNADEEKPVTREHFQKSHLQFPIVQDERDRLANQYGALKTPHVFIVSNRGQIEYQGGVDNSHSPDGATKHFLADALSELSRGEPVQVKETRTLGCLIERP